MKSQRQNKSDFQVSIDKGSRGCVFQHTSVMLRHSEQPMMRGAFLLLVLPTLAVSVNSFYATKVYAFHDKKISQSVMWSLKNVNKFRCVSECLKEKHCLSFHFSPSEQVCVALREQFDGSNVASIETLGYQLFQTNRPLAKVGSDCKQNLDCSTLNNSHCNHGVCRCDVGYGIYGDVCRIITAFAKVGSNCELDLDCSTLNNSNCIQGACRCDVGYGIYRDFCRILTECSFFSNNFTLYKHTLIIDYDFRRQIRSSYESCPAFCISDTKCQSADFDFVLKICYLNTITWFESVRTAHVTSSPTFHFFQRECIW